MLDYEVENTRLEKYQSQTETSLPNIRQNDLQRFILNQHIVGLLLENLDEKKMPDELRAFSTIQTHYMKNYLLYFCCASPNKTC